MDTFPLSTNQDLLDFTRGMQGRISGSGRVKVTSDKGYLRLQFPSSLSRQIYNKRQFFKGLGRRDTPQNREWADRIAARIQADIDHPDCEDLFDPSLTKYFETKVPSHILYLEKDNNSVKLKDIWLEFIEYKRKTGQVSETTYRTRYNRTFTSWLKPYLNEPLSYELADRILFDLLNSGINKINLKKLISALKSACDRAISREIINRNFFISLGDNIKVIKKSKQLIEEEDYRAYSLEERDIIIARFRNSEKPSEAKIADLIEFLFLTGCRLGEAFALKWRNIKSDWIVFDQSYSSETKITKSTKTDTVRIFRTKAYNRLNQLIDNLKLRDYSDNDYVFTTITGKQYDRFKLSALWLGISRNKEKYYSGAITQLVREGKISQYLKPSSTRHTFITIQAHSGTDLKLLADSVGNSVDVIYNHYLGVSKDATIADV